MRLWTPEAADVAEGKSALIFVCALVFLASAAPVFAQAAASPSPARYALISDETPANASGQSVADTLSSLAGVKQSRRISLAPEIASPSGLALGDTLVLNLFPETVYTARIDRVTTNINGTVTVRGRLEGYPLGFVLISTTAGQSLGSIEVPEKGEHYRIQSEPASQAHVLLDMDPSQMDKLEDAPSPVPPLVRPLKVSDESDVLKGALADGPADPADVKIMVLYTPAASAWAVGSGGIANVIAQALAKGQLALDNSNTILTINLVHSEEVSYTESGSAGTDLDRLTFHEGFDPWGWEGTPRYLDAIHDLRSQYAADLVSMFTLEHITGGVGWLLEYDTGEPEFGFCIVRVQQAGWTYTHVHETGHNMGCDHHKEQTPQPGLGLFDYSAGWRWVGIDTNRYCSVMTYESGSYFADGLDHDRVAHFSNPSIDYAGVPTGDAADGDNARDLREVKHVVAGYRVLLDEAVDEDILTWTSGGDREWFGQIESNHDGTDAARSGAVANLSESWMQTTVVGPGDASFWWKVSSEATFDFLEFYIDVDLQHSISGEVGWQQKSYPIASGSHTLKWRYMKDEFVADGSDCGWVDQFTWTLPGLTIISQPVSQAVPEGLSATFTVGVSGGVGPISYAWQKDDMPLTDASLSAYTIASVQVDDEGDYTCLVTDEGVPESIESDAATLTVLTGLPVAGGAVLAAAVLAAGLLGALRLRRRKN